MGVTQLLRDARRLRFWRHFTQQFLSAVGLAALLLGLTSVLFPDALAANGTRLGVLVLTGSILYALAMSWPRVIAEYYAMSNTTIRVIEGDLFACEGHLVVGMCTTFDTQVPNIISLESVQAGFLKNIYHDDVALLDEDLTRALSKENPVGHIEKPGKTARFNIGTVATLKDKTRCYFCVAYTEMNERNEARATVGGVWQSLDSLWAAACEHANGGVIAMPVIGGGQSRLAQILPTESSIRLVAMSFVLASRKERIGRGIDIVVPSDAYARLDLWELRAFLRALQS